MDGLVKSFSSATIVHRKKGQILSSLYVSHTDVLVIIMINISNGVRRRREMKTGEQPNLYVKVMKDEVQSVTELADKVKDVSTV